MEWIVVSFVVLGVALVLMGLGLPRLLWFIEQYRHRPDWLREPWGHDGRREWAAEITTDQAGAYCLMDLVGCVNSDDYCGIEPYMLRCDNVKWRVESDNRLLATIRLTETRKGGWLAWIWEHAEGGTLKSLGPFQMYQKTPLSALDYLHANPSA